MKENSRPTATPTSMSPTTSDVDHNNNSSAPSVQHHHHHHQHQPHQLTTFSDSFQHPSSSSADGDLTKRKSPSIFSSVEELARGSSVDRPSLIIPPPSLIATDHVTSTPVIPALRPPIMFDLSTDSGYGDSSLRDVISGLDRATEMISKTIDDVITTPPKMDTDFRPIVIKPIATTAPLLPHHITSVSALNSITADASKTRLKEKLQLESEISAFPSVAMDTISSPQLQQQPQENLHQIHVTSPQLVAGKNPQLTDGRNCLEDADKLQLIRGGFVVKTPLLTRTTDTPSNTQRNFGKSDLLAFDVEEINEQTLG